MTQLDIYLYNYSVRSYTFKYKGLMPCFFQALCKVERSTVRGKNAIPQSPPPAPDNFPVPPSRIASSLNKHNFSVSIGTFAFSPILASARRFCTIPVKNKGTSDS